jgi:hypothetical protein
MPLFCRHNRLTANCPICSRELEAERKAHAPSRPARKPAERRTRTTTARRGASRAPGGLVTRRLARAQDDGYRNLLVPGLRATADAERLAGALTGALLRLEPPGPYDELVTEPDLEQATWLAFLLALAPDEEAVVALLEAPPAWTDADAVLPDWAARPATAYRAWAQRAGSQAAGITGEPDWTPERRFARAFERLALPGFNRAARFEMLAVLGAAERYPLAAGTLGLGLEDDATTLAAKRILHSGDRMLLERRARELADAAELPLVALDRGFADWGTPGVEVEPAEDAPAALRRALNLR